MYVSPTPAGRRTPSRTLSLALRSPLDELVHGGVDDALDDPIEGLGVDVGSVYEVRQDAPNDPQRFADELNIGAHPVAFMPADVLLKRADSVFEFIAAHVGTLPQVVCVLQGGQLVLTCHEGHALSACPFRAILLE